MSKAAMDRERVGTALRAAGGVVRPGNAGDLALTLKNGEPFHGSVRVDGNWVAMTVPADGLEDGPDSLWRVVRINGRLLRDCRLVRWDAGCALRSDVPFTSPQTVDERIAWTCDALRKAHDLLGDGSGKEDAESPNAAETDHRAALEQYCRDAGWEPVAPDNTASPVRVSLDVRHGPHRAELMLDPSGAVRAEVSVGNIAAGKLKTASRTALALLLLRASAVVRMTRGFARTHGKRTFLGFGATCAPTPALAAELAHALSALSVVCSLCSSEEIDVLTDEAMAALFLSTQGMALCETGSRQHENRKKKKGGSE
jgi:hypothetical protein